MSTGIAQSYSTLCNWQYVPYKRHRQKTGTMYSSHIDNEERTKFTLCGSTQKGQARRLSFLNCMREMRDKSTVQSKVTDRLSRRPAS